MRFRLVDRILGLDEGPRIRARKAVSFEEYRLSQVFGIADELPASLLVEAMLQAGQWLVMTASGFTRLALMVRITRIELPRPARRGEIVELDVHLRSCHDDSVLLDGRGTVDGVEVIRGAGCLATLAPLADFEDPADLRVLFDELAPGVTAVLHPGLTGSEVRA